LLTTAIRGDRRRKGCGEQQNEGAGASKMAVHAGHPHEAIVSTKTIDKPSMMKLAEARYLFSYRRLQKKPCGLDGIALERRTASCLKQASFDD
jgi:hypothetical protein